jgi:tripeptidyl-peptidase-2
MVQVDKAFEYLKANRDIETEDVLFSVKIQNRAEGGRGIYLRQPDECSVRQKFSVRIDPRFRREDITSEENQRQKIRFEMNCSVQTTESWVKAPEHCIIYNPGRLFEVEVDPTGLSHGAHTAKVLGMDSNNPQRGVLWSVPITVVKPLPSQRDIELGRLEFELSEVKRFFLAPPPGSTWMDVTLTDARNTAEDNEPRLVWLHTVQLLPHASFRDFGQNKRFAFLPSQTIVSSISVEEGITCEVAIARNWSVQGTTKLNASIRFRGIRPVPNNIHVAAGDCGALVRINSDLANESANPTAKLTKWKTPLRPKPDTSLLSPLGDPRDIFPSRDKEIYQLILTYEFEQEEKGSFTPIAPALQDVIYESGYESQLILVFDGEKRYLGVSDARPASVTAPKDAVTVRVQIRHDDPSKLESLKDMILWIERELGKEIVLPAYPTKEELTVGKSVFKKRTLRKGCCASVFFSEPLPSKLPSAVKQGDILLGSATYCDGDPSLPGEGKRPGGFPISYAIGPKASKVSAESETPKPKDERTPEQRIDEAIRDLQVEQLGKLTLKEQEEGKFEELYAKFQVQYPDHLPLRMARLKYLDSHEKRSEMLDKVVSAAEAVVSGISEDELALNLGRKVDSDDPKAVKVSRFVDVAIYT